MPSRCASSDERNETEIKKNNNKNTNINVSYFIQINYILLETFIHKGLISDYQIQLICLFPVNIHYIYNFQHIFYLYGKNFFMTSKFKILSENLTNRRFSFLTSDVSIVLFIL